MTKPYQHAPDPPWIFRTYAGHSTAEKATADFQSNGAHPTVVLLDENGDVGRLYDAKTTPQMFLIAPDGALLYKGAIYDQPTISKDSDATAVSP